MESDLKLKSLIESSADIISMVDGNGKILYISPSFKKVFGYDAQDDFERWGTNIIHPDDLTVVLKTIENFKASPEKPIHFLLRVKHKKGTYMHIEGTAINLLEIPFINSILIVLRDITEKKISEIKIRNNFNELQNASKRQSSILNALPANIALLDKDGYIIEVNHAWEKLQSTNFFTSEIYNIGDNYLYLLENLHRELTSIGEQLAEGVKTILRQEKKKILYEFVCETSGQKRWFKAQVTPLLEQKNEGVVVMLTDITERKSYEEKIFQSNERYRLVTQATHDAIWDWNLITNEIYWSEGYKNLFGNYDEYTSNFEEWEKRVHPEDIERVLEKMMDTIENSISGHWEDEYRFIKTDGSIAYAYDRGNIIYDEKNKPVRMLGAMVDITARKLAELERDKITADLIQRNNDLEQFAYIISHNLRGPVANIIGCTDILKDISWDENLRKEIINALSTSVKKLDGVIWDLNQILQVKRDINEKKVSVNFSQLVEDIKVSIANIIRKEKVEIHTNFKKVDKILTVRTYMYSIFYNLISNSIKYKQPDLPPQIKISTRKVKDKVEITFSDNGMGMDLSSKGAKIFGLYKRFHSHTEGKGVGLFMVKTQVEALGGSISVKSEENKGTEFLLCFDL